MTPDPEPSHVPSEGIQVHKGYVGLVFDTREIFRKGFTASTVEVNFATHGNRNITIPVDPVTNLAILSLDVDSLSSEEESAFAEGVAIEITVFDPDQETLVIQNEGSIQLDSSNQALVLNTTLSPVVQPVALRDDLPYLIQVEGKDGILLNFADNNSAASFDDVGLELVGIGDERGTVVWGDYDVDGDLDVLVGGVEQTRVYRNDDGDFVDIHADIPNLYQTTLDWGDFDNDYDLDILMVGENSEIGRVARIYRNEGGTYREYPTELTGLFMGSSSWGDYDNDGDLDIVVTGTNEHRYTTVYRNDVGVFTDIGAGLPGLHYGTAEWGDFDGDNDLDLLLAGGTISDDICELYEFEAGVFTLVETADFLDPPSFSYADWGDFDGDGDLDLLVTGQERTLVYRNEGSGTFLEMGVGLEGGGSAVWGDFDNDNDLDILLATNSLCRVYRNDGPQGFTPIEQPVATFNGRAMIDWGDFDNNGAVDILLSVVGDFTRIYRADPGAGFDADSEIEQDNVNQEFLFVPVDGVSNTYIMEKAGEVDGKCWCHIEDTGYLKYQHPDPAAGEPAAHLEALTDEDGWMRLRLAGTDSYLKCTNGVVNRLLFSDEDSDRFRLISANIDWAVVNRGTEFNQPIMPPARLDFAYRGTLHNCSSATFEEVIGRSEERTTTSTIGTTESLQVFSGNTQTMQITLGYEVKASIGWGVDAEITQSGQSEFSHEWTTQQTRATENTWSNEASTLVQVSRTRTLTLQPYTAVEVSDAVKTINNVIIPYTQVLRISATNKDTGEPLTGLEIRSQMLFNFVGGVITAVEDDYIDIGFRGQVIIDRLMHATANIDELEGACD